MSGISPPASSPAVRKTMQGNRSRDTKPELAVRRMLRGAGFPGYRIHWRIDDTEGGYICRPDICYPKEENCDIRPWVLLASVPKLQPLYAENEC